MAKAKKVTDYGAVNWEKRDIRYSQNNNIIETFLDKLKAKGQVAFRFESCNVEAMACAVEAVGGSFKVPLPVCPITGKAFMGHGDLAFDYMNSPYGSKLLPINSSAAPNNEFSENLTWYINHFTDCEARLFTFKGGTKAIPEAMRASFKKGASIVLSYRTDYGGGGHYHTITRYIEGRENRFNAVDPWDGNTKHCEHGGWQERYDDAFYVDRIRPRFIQIIKKG